MEEISQPNIDGQQQNRELQMRSIKIKKYIYGTTHDIDKTFPIREYKDLKESIIRMAEKKYLVKECIICIEPIINTSACRMLSCFHIYHSHCIGNWLLSNSSCPMCNKKLITKEDVRINQQELEKNSISVDMDCFYSDHIVERIPDLLTPKEMKRTHMYAMPHEFHNLRYKKKKEKQSKNSD